jgi:hypothetical protein
MADKVMIDRLTRWLNDLAKNERNTDWLLIAE